jgi:hypothetical protein
MYLGTIACPMCGRAAASGKTKTGTRTLACTPPCRFTAYAPEGSAAARRIDAGTKPDSDSDAAPPAPAPGKAAPALLIGG